MTFRKSNFQSLTIRNNFMFTQVMSKEDNCKHFLEMVLGFPIERIEIDYEKSLTFHPDYHGIRLDIYAKDECNTHYNVEMQVVRENIEKRIRYYHSEMDMTLLPTGMSYVSLPDTYVIFICDFDPFGAGKYVYHLNHVLQEVPEKSYNDGSHSIILSTKGTNADAVPAELIAFLQFIENDAGNESYVSSDSYVNQLQRSMKELKHDRSMEERYMRFEELLEIKKKEGFDEGLEQGHRNGAIDQSHVLLLQLLSKLDTELPPSLIQHINDTNDEAILQRFFTAAMEAQSLEEFMTSIDNESK